MAEWVPIKPGELQPGTRFRLVGKEKEYVVTGAVTKDGDVYNIPTTLGTGRLKANERLEYRSAFI